MGTVATELSAELRAQESYHVRHIYQSNVYHVPLCSSYLDVSDPGSFGRDTALQADS